MAGTATYRGRFAPSPTGPLHLGSLIAALASYLDARRAGGRWLVRMEDLDPPRQEPGAAESILRSLEEHGLLCDEEVIWQSRRGPAYDRALAGLADSGLLFCCDCTRAMLGPGGACGGRCQPRQAEVGRPCALRIAVPAQTAVNFSDAIQGLQSASLGTDLPDFILLRKDGLYAYQLAVVVDDAAQGISHVVRGSDLLESTPRQIYLQGALGTARPAYSHLPVITNAQGQKFSKQNHAPALASATAGANLRRALAFLGQPPPPAELAGCEEILQFATGHWDLAAVPRVMAAPAAAGEEHAGPRFTPH